MGSSSSANAHHKKSRAPLFIGLSLLVLTIICYFNVPVVHTFFNTAWQILSSGNEEKIRAWVSDFGWLGPFILVLTMIAQMFLIVIPSILLMVVSILAYGPIRGSLIVFVSIFAASSVGYLIGHYLGRNRVERIIGRATEEKMTNFLNDYGFWAVIITRLNPFLSNDAISFVGGMLRMGYWKFTGASLVGIAPLVIFIAIIGKSTTQLKTGLLWGSLVSLFLFVIYIWWDKKKKQREHSDSK